jgi:hypothetical protein
MEERRKHKRMRLGPIEYGELMKTLRTIEREQLCVIYVEIMGILTVGGRSEKDIKCQYTNSSAKVAEKYKKRLQSFQKQIKELIVPDAREK